MPVPGSWTLYFDWGSEGMYSSIPMTFNADGTFSTGDGYTGLWVAVAGQLLFTFDSSQTTYAGNLADMSVTGIFTTFTGADGSFYLLQEGAPTESALARRVEGKADASGAM